MNSRTRKVLYQQLVKRDGEWCDTCKQVGDSKTLVIDHKDNNNAHNEPSNYQLLCRSCNNRKNPRGPAKKKSTVYVRGDEYEPPRRPTPEFEKNKKYEPIFRRWLEGKIKELGKMELHDTIYSGAEIAESSPATINRYLGKMCSSEGKFEVYEGDDGKKYVRSRMQSDKPPLQQPPDN